MVLYFNQKSQWCRQELKLKAKVGLNSPFPILTTVCECVRGSDCIHDSYVVFTKKGGSPECMNSNFCVDVMEVGGSCRERQANHTQDGAWNRYVSLFKVVSVAKELNPTIITFLVLIPLPSSQVIQPWPMLESIPHLGSSLLSPSLVFLSWKCAHLLCKCTHHAYTVLTHIHTFLGSDNKQHSLN